MAHAAPQIRKLFPRVPEVLKAISRVDYWVNRMSILIFFLAYNSCASFSTVNTVHIREMYIDSFSKCLIDLSLLYFGYKVNLNKGQ